jgi:hypothetical protein
MRCNSLGIPYETMKRLNFIDLQYIIVENDICTLQNNFKQLENSRQARLGITIREATNEEIIKMHES